MRNILVLVSLVTISLSAQNAAGLYVLQNVREVGSELLLKPDGTFEYMLAYGAADYTSAGTWRVEGSLVFLTSPPQKELPFRLIHSGRVQSAVTRIRVQAPQGQPVPNIDVVLKQIPEGKDDPAQARTDQDGIALYPPGTKAHTVLFRIPVYGFESAPFPIKPGDNDLTFQINGDAITHVPFMNEKLSFHGNELELRYWDKSEVMRYRREM